VLIGYPGIGKVADSGKVKCPDKAVVARESGDSIYKYILNMYMYIYRGIGV